MTEFDLKQLKLQLKSFCNNNYPKKDKRFIESIYDIELDENNKIINILYTSQFDYTKLSDKTNETDTILKRFFKEHKVYFNYNNIKFKQTEKKQSKENLKTTQNKQTTKNNNSGLNPIYSFENFVVGENSTFAYHTCLAISNRPSIIYNPCLVYGDVGLGKTHLVQALGNKIVEKLKLKVTYINCSDFIESFIASIQNNWATKFKNNFKNTDVLIIDDIHSLEGKGQTQDALFEIFNSLKESNKQLVFTCDKPIFAVKIQERLSSRIGSGVSVNLKAPDYETRYAIIKQKCKELDLKLPADVIDFIAKNVITNIRTIENSLKTLNGYYTTLRRNIDLQIAKDLLNDIIINKDTPEDKTEKIIEYVCAFYNKTPSEIRGKSNKKIYSEARQIIMYLLDELTDLSSTEIGTLIGGRDHSTVLYSINKVKERLQIDNNLKEQIEQIKEKIN